MNALLTLIIRPLVLFVVTGAMVSFLRYTVTMWREVPSLLYELYVPSIPLLRSIHICIYTDKVNRTMWFASS